MEVDCTGGPGPPGEARGKGHVSAEAQTLSSPAVRAPPAPRAGTAATALPGQNYWDTCFSGFVVGSLLLLKGNLKPLT